MLVDPSTLFLVISGVAAGVFGARRTATSQAASTWRDLYEAERQRTTDKSEQVTAQTKQIAELTGDLAALRARPDMTRLAEMIRESTAQMAVEHAAIIDAITVLKDSIPRTT